MSNLELRVEGVHADSIPNLARFAHYIGVVSQINGSLIEEVTIHGYRNSGPEQTSPDGKHLMLGAQALPDMRSGKPAAIAAWCGAALHGFAHSRYSPRTNEPLRGTLAKRKLHKTWNMMEDARIERLLLRDFPGWTPHLMGAVNHILLKPARRGAVPNLSNVYPLLAGRTYLPAELRQEAFEAFANEHSDYIADAVRDLIFRYMRLVDPGSEDHDEAVDLVTRMRALLGDFGTDCGSSEVDPSTDTERQWTDPGDPEDDDDESDDDDGDDGGNQAVTDDDGESGDGESDDDGDADGGAGDDESDDDGDADGGAGDDESDDDGDADGGAGDDESDDDGESDGADDDGEASGSDDDDDDGDDGEESDDDGRGTGSTGSGSRTSRLADWAAAIDSALEQDERLNDIRDAVTTGPLPAIKLNKRDVVPVPVPVMVQMSEQDVARELRVLMDGARPGMRRRIDRGRFNVARVVREGGTTRPEEMFDRHDPGALRSTGCAVAMLVDVSGSMKDEQIAGAMASLWSVDRAVSSVRGAFKSWAFGQSADEMPASEAGHMWSPKDKDGQTSPLLGLSAAQAWLSQQREPNKLCIIATDGAWNGAESCGAVLEAMFHSGVQVAVFGIGLNVPQYTKHGALTFRIESAADLGPAVGEMLVNRVRSSLHR